MRQYRSVYIDDHSAVRVNYVGMGQFRYAAYVAISDIGKAAYERVAESIRHDIRSGKLKPGDRLPGNRAVAEIHRVSLGTAQKALGVLHDEGWVSTTPAVGVFVADSPPEGEPVTLARVNQALTDLQAEVRELRALVEALQHEVD